MSTRPRQGNVIYANFGSKSVPPPVAQPEAPVFPEYSPAARWLIRELGEADRGRLTRGRDYARTGHVLSLEMGNGGLSAQVAGSHNEPFHVKVTLPHRGPDDLTRVVRAMASTAGSLRRAKEGHLEQEVLESLVGEGVVFRCDCPDPAPVCKHAVAVAAVAAQRIEDKPELLFELRGLDMAWLEQQMVQQAREVSQEAARSTDERFWRGQELPELPTPASSPALDDSDMDLLHKAMRTVSYTAVEQLRAVADIEDMYDYLVGR
ncbi:SWIM zinc finger family protein [Corynebacterium mastitidis]|uniref:SWIM zinc finger family protein n=1 Tax=Corynebacterium mastitidis TaxID=161890 RepID=UPI002549D4BD|nr:hypothetical protein [Corynebacterium mastitidis]MDK8451217.1 hypothetical protein [Corynebacterium mastitidis]